MRRTWRHLVALAAMLTLLLPAAPASAQAPLTIDGFFQMSSHLVTVAQPHGGGFRGMVTGQENLVPGVSGITHAGTGLFPVPPAIIIDFAERTDLPGNITAHPGDRNYGAAFDQSHGFLIRLDGPFASGDRELQEGGIQFYDPNGFPLGPDPSFPFGVGEGTTLLTALVHSPVQSGSILGQPNSAGGLNISLNGFTVFEIDAEDHTDLLFFGPISTEWAAYNSGADDFSPTDAATFENLGAQITERQPAATEVVDLATLEPGPTANVDHLLRLAEFYTSSGLDVPEDVAATLANATQPPANEAPNGGDPDVAAPPANTDGSAEDPVADAPPVVADTAASEDSGGGSSGGLPAWLLGIIGVTVLAGVGAATKIGPFGTRGSSDDEKEETSSDVTQQGPLAGEIVPEPMGDPAVLMLDEAERRGFPLIDGKRKIANWQFGNFSKFTMESGEVKLYQAEGLFEPESVGISKTLTLAPEPKAWREASPEERTERFGYWVDLETMTVTIGGIDHPDLPGGPDPADEPAPADDEDAYSPETDGPKPLGMDNQLPPA